MNIGNDDIEYILAVIDICVVLRKVDRYNHIYLVLNQLYDKTLVHKNKNHILCSLFECIIQKLKTNNTKILNASITN